jgi:hypothetical protein
MPDVSKPVIRERPVLADLGHATLSGLRTAFGAPFTSTAVVGFRDQRERLPAPPALKFVVQMIFPGAIGRQIVKARAAAAGDLSDRSIVDVLSHDIDGLE